MFYPDSARESAPSRGSCGPRPAAGERRGVEPMVGVDPEDAEAMAAALAALSTPEADNSPVHCPAEEAIVADFVPLSLPRSAARLAVTARHSSRSVPDHPLKNASDMELSLRIKYGAEHIKKHSDVDQFFSIHQYFPKTASDHFSNHYSPQGQ